ncbi:MAG: hypothetical protein SPD44_06695 [Prevotella sp.]|nr:hypothetical protein [Prevotella sp.]MDY4752381.1 hypothetical protein [Prevotella sp.]
MISKVMKRKYITPVVYFFKFEEESELLANTFRDADSTPAASDLKQNVMSGTSELGVTNDGLNQDAIGAKDHDWFFDDNAFSDF